ncbi:hypothetical protein JR050_01850 [Bacillus sp. RD4P76]|uniref:LURP-one-related family protein n=2 Tax=Bacillus suaedaesalsae TaxID=2810349 RepID=A0ABS2DEJ3_9BACI|nr:hypothetical protein [Bacillus suaedaesalsae]
MNNSLYFSDNFFSSGKTDIYNEAKEKVGELDLKSAFSSSIEVLNDKGEHIVTGKFTFFGNRWIVSDYHQQELGELKAKFSFFTKKYQYHAMDRGMYMIESEAFSRKYDIYDMNSNLVGSFEKVSGFFSSPAFRLMNHSEHLSSHELIAVVMGVSNIQKRNSAAANSSV